MQQNDVILWSLSLTLVVNFNYHTPIKHEVRIPYDFYMKINACCRYKY